MTAVLIFGFTAAIRVKVSVASVMFIDYSFIYSKTTKIIYQTSSFFYKSNTYDRWSVIKDTDLSLYLRMVPFIFYCLHPD